MDESSPRVVTVIGAGTIGLGWITLFAAYGHTVVVNSRRPDAEKIVEDGLRAFAAALPGGPADPGELAARLRFVPDVAEAVADADVVQENAPEDVELKRGLFGVIGGAAPPGALLLSSTSTLLPDDFATELDDPGRVVVGHPFNPPHVVPLVEVVAGARTAPGAVDDAVAFYRSVGKSPVVLRKPVPRFVANRLQSALLQESIHLVSEGVVTIEELDEIVTRSIGLRWAVIGPFLAFHLGGGEGGLRKWLSHLGRGLEQSWRELGSPSMSEETIELLSTAAERAYGTGDYARLAADRDRKQNAVLVALEEAARAEAALESASSRSSYYRGGRSERTPGEKCHD